ncbi:TPA: histidine kinase, partial [Aeromonas veronii]
ESEYNNRLWNIGDAHNDYGYIEFFFSNEVTILHDTEQLIFAFCNLLSQSLSLYYKEQQQQQLLLFKERNTIAQTLHDSIAQSLSYLKIKISLLQRDPIIISSSQVDNVSEMRCELNEAYSNIRKLISTFRIPYKKIETLILLKDAIAIFNDTYGFNIRLEYKDFYEDYSHEQ